MKILLRIAGVIALLFGLYVIVGEQLVGTSGSAFVNAELVRVRAPLSGDVTMERLTPGARIEADMRLGDIVARRTSTSAVDALAERLAVARAQYEALSQVGPAGPGDTMTYSPELETIRSGAEAEAIVTLLERARIEQGRVLSSAVSAPVSGLVWSTPVDDGEYVVEGDVMAYIVDCSSVFVHASVDERLYNRLALGDVAQVRLHDGPVIEASVALLGGFGARTQEETIAISPSQGIRDGFTVYLRAPALAGEGGCLLGRTGRVVFSEGPLSFLGGLFGGGS